MKSAKESGNAGMRSDGTNEEDEESDVDASDELWVDANVTPIILYMPLLVTENTPLLGI